MQIRAYIWSAHFLLGSPGRVPERPRISGRPGDGFDGGAHLRDQAKAIRSTVQYSIVLSGLV